MTVVCPACGADGQEVGKYCENCGFFIADASQVPAGAAVPAAGAAPAPGPDTTLPDVPTMPTSPIADTGGQAAPPAVVEPGGAQFAVVRDGQANPAEGFTINQEGEYLVGRSDAESGSLADVDLRQWVQPLEIQGVKQYLVHRKQCYLGLAADGVVTIRPWPGYERDTLVKPASQTGFTSLQDFGTIRPPRPDQTFPLEPGDRIYMGDPDALQYFLNGDPTAQGSYVVFELLAQP